MVAATAVEAEAKEVVDWAEALEAAVGGGAEAEEAEMEAAATVVLAELTVDMMGAATEEAVWAAAAVAATVRVAEVMAAAVAKGAGSAAVARRALPRPPAPHLGLVRC